MTVVQLRRLGSILNGGTPTSDPSNWRGNVPWATPVDLAKADGGEINSTERTLTQSGVASGSILVPAESVMVSTRAPIGYTACNSVDMAMNQGCKAFVPHSGVHARFVQYSLVAAVNDLKAAGTGSTFMELSSEGLAAHSVPAHGLSEQRRIADFLDDRVARIDQIIAARREQIRGLSESYMAWIAEQLDGLPQMALRRVLVSIEQGWSPVADSVRAMPGEAGVLRLGAVRDGSFNPEQNKAFIEGDEPRPEYLIQVSDLLVTRANTPALVGDAAVVEDTGESSLFLSDLIYRLRMSDYDAHAASVALRSPRVRGEISVLARGTSGSMPKLRGEDIGNLPVPAITKSLQRQLGIADREQRSLRSDRVGQIGRSISHLLEYKSSLITAAVTGELDVTTAGSRIPG